MKTEAHNSLVLFLKITITIPVFVFRTLPTLFLLMKSHLNCVKVNFYRALIATLFISSSSTIQSQGQLDINMQTTSLDLPYFSSDIFAYSNFYQAQILNPSLVKDKQLSIKLRISSRDITVVSNPAFFPNPISIEGQPVVSLSNSDLAEYFELENLNFQGYSKELYLLNGGLPEGNYQVCYQLQDISTDAIVPLSIEKCIFQYVRFQDPPILINPLDESMIKLNSQLSFNWLDRNISFHPITYKISIYEDNNANFQDLILYDSPVEEFYTNVNSFVLPNNKGYFREGINYIGFVRASSESGVVRFKNNGFSQPVHFSFYNEGLMRNSIFCENYEQQCDDDNDCTIDDKYDQYCYCYGTPIETVTFQLDNVPLEPICYCTNIDICYNSNAIENISLTDPNGNLVVLDPSSNNFGFNFPYCIEGINPNPNYPECNLRPNAFQLVHDLNAFIINNQWEGFVEITDNEGPCNQYIRDPNGNQQKSRNESCEYSQSLIFRNTNFAPNSIYFNFPSNEGEGANTFSSYSCPAPLNSTLTAISSCDHPTDYLWSTGATTEAILYDPVVSCYSVTVTCEVTENTFCEFVGYYGGGCKECSYGTPCNDFNDCTINDIIVEDCKCKGTQTEDFIINSVEVFEELCNYCIIINIPYYNLPLEECIIIEGLTILGPDNEYYFLNEHDLDFNFPYCLGGCCQGQPLAIDDLQSDLSAWIQSKGFEGQASTDRSCGSGIYIAGTNIQFSSIQSYLLDGSPINLEIQQSNCIQSSNLIGYELVVQSDCDSISNYEWSNGSTDETIQIDNLNGCYEVTITCERIESQGYCELVGTFGQNCEDCIIGTPCNDENPCTIGDVIGPDCNCVGVESPDSDNDGVCDQLDICFNSDDGIDSDNDGVPDGCDLCNGQQDSNLPQYIIDLLTDDNPDNDPDISLPPFNCGVYPCIDELSIDEDPLIINETCNYCLDITSLISSPASFKYFTGLSYFDENGTLVNKDFVNNSSFETTFENGYGQWYYGGSFCNLISEPYAAYSYPKCIELAGDHQAASSLYLSTDMCNNISFKINFVLKTKDFEIGDKILFEIDNGAGFQEVKSWEYEVDFYNNRTYFKSFNAEGPFADDMIIRLRSQAASNNGKCYLDNIVFSETSNSLLTCNEPFHLTFRDALKLNLVDEEFATKVILTNGSSPACNIEGDVLSIIESKYKMVNAFYKVDGLAGSISFTSPNCGNQPPGARYKTLSFDLQCDPTSILWSNGSTSSTITVPAVGSYSLEVICSDGCKYNDNIDGDCIVGASCQPSPCHNFDGYINEYCVCVGGTINPSLAANCDDEDPCPDPFVDCEPIDCDDKVYFNYIKAYFVNYYRHCIDLSLFNNHTLTSIVVNTSLGPFTLDNNTNINGRKFFHFPYCETINGDPCVNGVTKNLKKFSSDFVYWSQAYSGEGKSYYEVFPEACIGSKALRISDLPFDRIEFYFDDYFTYSKGIFAYEKPSGYYLRASVINSSDCQSPEYLWSDPSIVGNQVFVRNQNIGYSVTVTCGDCSYELTSPGPHLCQVGAPCGLTDNCIVEAYYDNECNCIPSVYHPDTDGDGVCDPFDICEGFDDNMDDDGDGIPNGCDSCETNGAICTYKASTEIPKCTIDSHLDSIIVSDPRYNINFNLASIATYFRFPYYISSGSGVHAPYATPIEELQSDLSNWLSSMGYNGVVILSMPTTSSSYLGISIKNTSLIFKSLYLNLGCIPIARNAQGFGPFEIQFDRLCTSSSIGQACNDGQPCTDFDHYDDNCICVGVYRDSDKDLVCDANDKCPGFPDHFDFNQNNIPDGCEAVTYICDGVEFSFCQYLAQMDALGSKIRPVNLIYFQNELKQFMNQSNWDMPQFNIDELKIDLFNTNDSDGDGIVDFLDPCPNTINPLNAQGYHSLSIFSACSCSSTIDAVKGSVLSYLLFSPLNEFLTFDDGSTMAPGCINALGMSVDENEEFFLIDNATGCHIEFFLDENCNCDFIKTNDYDDNDICPDDIIIVDPPCEVFCTTSDPCKYVTLDTACVCLKFDLEDSDGDGVCDFLDVCPGVNDFLDNDRDGIPDCLDDCPNLAGSIGEACDDGDPCTYGDLITEGCECIGEVIDLDDDEVFDCQDCKIMFTDPNIPGATPVEVDRYGPFISNPNSYMIDCDVCPGLDDKIDSNGNGVPDCIDPPYYPIGCPADIILLPGEGIVLVFDNADDQINESDLPNPIGGVFMNSNNKLTSSDYITITNIREVGTTYEVFYSFDAIKSNTDYSYMGVSFAGHQNCSFTGSNDLSDVNCPSNIKVLENKLILKISGEDGSEIDILKLQGSYSLEFINNGVVDFSTSANVELSNITPSSTESNNFDITLGSGEGMPDFNTYPGEINIVLPNGITCPYQNGVVTPCDTGTGAKPGDPCDCDPTMMDCECYTHFRLDNDCNCIGDPKPDTDGDGICDEFDPCPDDQSIPCKCDDLEMLPQMDITLENGSDLSIPFDMANAGAYSNLSINIIGGPPDYVQPGEVELTSPLIIANLPKGYPLTIVITANCANGSTSTYEIPIDPVPFDGDPGLCGLGIEDVDLNSLTFLPELNQGDEFLASDFSINVKQSKGSYGSFTGKGYIKVPLFGSARINVSFSNIKIANNYQMIDGLIVVNGFGLALLGDDISDQINNGVNNILNVLTDILDILNEVEEILKSIDELIATTEDLVDDETKNCVTKAANELKALNESAKQFIDQNQEVPANLVQQIKDKTQELKICKDAYNEALSDVIVKLYNVFKAGVQDNFGNDCTNYSSNYELLESWPQTQINEVLNTKIPAIFGSGNDPIDLEDGITIGHDIKWESSDFPNYGEITNFYNVEYNYALCKMLEKMQTTDGFTFDDSKVFFKAFIGASVEITDLLKAELSSSKTPETIYNDNKVLIYNSLKKYLTHYLYLNNK